jgi:NAD(P)-dependent dehydrogenase (short-subunit alcohol dehydrogenase family)
MSREVQKKVALITGGNRGLGLETARQLGIVGMTVLLGARELAKGEASAQRLQEQGIDARAVKLDVTNAEDVRAAAEWIEREFGRLDVLVNNAGVMHRSLTGNNTSKTTRVELQETFDANLFGVVAVTQAMLPLIRKSEAGRIVNVSSLLASQSLHARKGSEIYDSKHFAYAASKVALNTFTLHLAHELKETKIKVNSADPGWVKTDMGGEDAPMEVKEGAKTVVELATLEKDGANGGYFHLGKAVPW